MSMDEELINFADDQADDLEQKFGLERFRDAVLYGTDWTVRTLLQQIEDGNIDLSPDFQRRDAWSPKNKSRFIESVALQLPIPQIVLAERKEQRGTYIVLDGKQRLLTLAQFAGKLPDGHKALQDSRSFGPLRLSGLTILDSLNGMTYSDLVNSPELSGLHTHFDNHTIRSALIRNWPDEDYLYEVFIRLNTGSAKLSPQELRQAMKPGDFTEFLSERSSQSKILQKILGIDGPDFRMRDVDLLLRMIAFSSRMNTYQGNLKTFLDKTHEDLNRSWDINQSFVEHLTLEIEAALKFLAERFGGEKFVGRRWRDGDFEKLINRAVLDAQLAVALPRSNREAIPANVSLVEMFKELCTDNREFEEAISGTTKSVRALKTRITAWKNKVESNIDGSLTIAELPDA